MNVHTLRPRFRWVAAAALAASALGTTALNASPAQATTTTGTQTTLVIVANYGTATGLSPADARSRIFTASNSANAFFKEVSGGRASLVGIKDPVNGDVVGPYHLSGTTGCTEANNEAYADAKADGYDPANYRHVVVWLGGDNCNGGWASTGGNWVNMSSWDGIDGAVHELGHNLGLAHAGTTTCKSGDGTPTPMSGGAVATSGLPSTCTTNEYGDPYDTMGDWSTHWYDAPQLADIGWITPSQVNTISKNGTYTIGAMEDQNASTRTARIGINTPLHGAYLYIAHRANTGQFDQFGTDNVTKGVQLTVASGRSTQHLLNMDPSDSSFHNSELQVGQTFTFPGKFTVTLTALDAATGAATVQVTFLPTYVTGQTLPAASVGTAYTTTIAGTGGTPAYTWYLSEGAVPPGMKIASASSTSVALSGTPNTSGTYSFKLRLKDSAGQMVWRTFTVAVS